VIDLSPMKRVDVSLDASVATIQGGATAADVISATGPHGLVAATGNCGTVGMVGLTLGGGMVHLLHAMVWHWTTCSRPRLCLLMAGSSTATNTRILICSGRCVAGAATSG
jgi:FAD/FMN-containing dehydrogenase